MLLERCFQMKADQLILDVTHYTRHRGTWQISNWRWRNTGTTCWPPPWPGLPEWRTNFSSWISDKNHVRICLQTFLVHLISSIFWSFKHSITAWILLELLFRWFTCFFVCAAYKPCGLCQRSWIKPEVLIKGVATTGLQIPSNRAEKARPLHPLSLIDRCLGAAFNLN